MPLPKQKISKRRRDFRRSHHALEMPTLSPCPRCRQPRIPHRVCPNCGYYHGREVSVTE
ncbi:MAG: 50S ribosomal protein L32 [Candidatus Dormiibacterota bacterium]